MRWGGFGRCSGTRVLLAVSPKKYLQIWRESFAPGVLQPFSSSSTLVFSKLWLRSKTFFSCNTVSIVRASPDDAPVLLGSPASFRKASRVYKSQRGI